MSKKILTLILFLTFFQLANAGGVSITSSVTTLNPGSSAVISLTITNSETHTLSDVSVAFVELSKGFSGSVCTSCNTFVGNVCTKYSDSCFTRINDLLSSNSLNVDFPIEVSSDITEGNYLAKFVIRYTVNKNSATEKTYDIIKTVPLSVISGSRPKLTITNVEIPELLKPNNNFVLRFNVTNYKSFDAKDIRIILEGSDIGTSIILVNNTNEFVVPLIKGNSSEKIKINLKTSPEIKTGAHSFNIKLNYSDSKNNYYSTTYKISTIIGGESNFIVSLQNTEPEFIQANKIAELTIGLINQGLLDASSVRMVLLKSNDFELGPINEEFIGDLDAGDYTSVDFEILPKKNNTILLPIRIYYVDSTGTNRQKDYNLTLEIGTTEFSRAKEMSSKKNNTFTYVLMGLSFVAVIYIWYKKRQKK